MFFATAVGFKFNFVNIPIAVNNCANIIVIAPIAVFNLPLSIEDITTIDAVSTAMAPANFINTSAFNLV